MQLFPAAAVMMAAICAGAQPPFSIEQALSAPFPTELTAAPGGDAVAWVSNDRGARNVWIAGAPDYAPRRITSYAEDDGQEVSGLAWRPDGGAIVFVRGEGANRQGESPNPTSNPAGVVQAVWAVSTAGGTPRQIGPGHSPAVSPDGKQVAFVRAGQIWIAPLNPAGEARQFFHARGDNGSLRWSPDGSAVAFVSSREDHSFIGVYDPARNSIRYLDPSVDLDDNPTWSPDGKSIAFLRRPTFGTRYFFGPRRTGEPWSIRVAEAATGRGREIFRAAEGRGSVFHPVVSLDQILWAEERLVFPWERDGWTHLYAIPAAGGEPQLLTAGAFMVEEAALSPDRRSVLYSSNQDDIDRRHLWRVAVTGGPPAALTSGRGIEWSPAPLAGGDRVALLRSDARLPARPALLENGRLRDLAPRAIPASFPAASMVEPQPVVFAATDGMEIHGQLLLPSSGAAGERRPAVIFLHGGSRRQMLLGWHYMFYYSNAYALNQFLASRGYVVLSVNYRSGTGYGLDFREALHFGPSGASEYQDVAGAALYLRSRSDVDPRRIGLWGGSYGGYLTALGLARASDLFAAGVDFHGVHDWSTLLAIPPQDEAARVAFRSSPMASVGTWRSPVLLIHGDDDRNVSFSQTVNLAEKLREQHVPFEQLIFPDEIHDFLTHGHWVAAYQAAAAFLDRKLAGR